jgi:hypothetical protein
MSEIDSQLFRLLAQSVKELRAEVQELKGSAPPAPSGSSVKQPRAKEKAAAPVATAPPSTPTIHLSGSKTRAKKTRTRLPRRKGVTIASIPSLSLPLAQDLPPTQNSAPRYETTLVVPDALVGHIVGREGRGLKQVTDITGARISAYVLALDSRSDTGIPATRHISIRGTEKQIGEALVVLGKRVARKRVRTPALRPKASRRENVAKPPVQPRKTGKKRLTPAPVNLAHKGTDPFPAPPPPASGERTPRPPPSEPRSRPLSGQGTPIGGSTPPKFWSDDEDEDVSMAPTPAAADSGLSSGISGFLSPAAKDLLSPATPSTPIQIEVTPPTPMTIDRASVGTPGSSRRTFVPESYDTSTATLRGHYREGDAPRYRPPHRGRGTASRARASPATAEDNAQAARRR